MMKKITFLNIRLVTGLKLTHHIFPFCVCARAYVLFRCLLDVDREFYSILTTIVDPDLVVRHDSLVEANQKVGRFL